MDEPIPEGTVAIIDGVRRILYDGYWLKAYEPPADSLDAKKRLIQALTRRLFNHVEHGISTQPANGAIRGMEQQINSGEATPMLASGSRWTVRRWCAEWIAPGGRSVRP